MQVIASTPPRDPHQRQSVMRMHLDPSTRLGTGDNRHCEYPRRLTPKESCATDDLSPSTVLGQRPVPSRTASPSWRAARLDPAAVLPGRVPSGQRAPPIADAELGRSIALPKADPSHRLQGDDPFWYIRGFPSILSSPSFRLWSVSPIRRLTKSHTDFVLLESTILDHRSPDHRIKPTGILSISFTVSQYPILN